MTWPKWHQSETFVGALKNVFLFNCCCSCPLCFKNHNFLLGVCGFVCDLLCMTVKMKLLVSISACTEPSIGVVSVVCST